MAHRLRLAMIQMFVTKSKEENIIRATNLIKEAVNNGAKLVALPEYFTCLCDPMYITAAKEPIPGPTTQLMADLAKHHSIHLIAGTIPEATDKDGKLYNSCSVLGPDGRLIVTHKKMHMFDVDLGPHLHITESEVNRPGSKFTVLNIGKFSIGIGVCLDMRYPEISRIYTQRGCNVHIYIGAFDATKLGPAHWDIQQRARAIDNQVYIATVAPARDTTAPYQSWGHSSIISPWGEIITQAGFEEEIIYADLDTDEIDEVKSHIDESKLRRSDLYITKDLTLEE